ncbi:nitric oxide reductase activation protein NorD [Pseudophaeobacter arcticus]|uniref:nitric oxide reductase activation protein NorD n=1 Tax=Pseudophaeobacter arcticus TaxID=385492 RepID=UPI0004086633|nr:VWA domain-containing protein [Pseudophaeobacter arcticus]
MAALHPLDLMDPEEAVGNIWHDYATKLGAQPSFPEAAIELAEVRGSLVLLFRALGGAASVELAEAPRVRSHHRQGLRRKLGNRGELMFLPTYDGERLCLPPSFDAFPEKALNQAAYFWLVALAATQPRLPPVDGCGCIKDRAQIEAMAQASDLAFQRCPGLRGAYQRMCSFLLATRPKLMLPREEARLEQAVLDQLNSPDASPVALPEQQQGSKTYLPFTPVPIWLTLSAPRSGTKADDAEEADEHLPAPAAATTTRKMAAREDRDEANRKDSLIIHRFEAILSWVESMNLNRSVDNDEDENAQKAADDQDKIILSRHKDKKTATRLRLHLDLAPADAEHERLADLFTYPEWDHRKRSYLPDHTRVLETEADTDAPQTLAPDPRQLRAVRRQFEALHPRRVMRPRQIEGSELDLDALIAARVDLQADGTSSDRIYQSLRQIDRDLSVCFLLDTSRSTEASVGDSTVLDIARESLVALAGGIDASGDRLGIWGFSSLRRDRVFLKKCKSFDAPMSAEVTHKICGLSPCHYTRLGAAIRHATSQLEQESSTRKLLLVLTDGKPNDLDHYEGIHGIEDSHMAVREARRMGHTVHGIVIDQDGQDWFARIFGRAGFTLLPDPTRLTRALPQIYRSLTQES